MNQEQSQHGSGALSLLICATHGRPQTKLKSNFTNRSLDTETVSITPIPLWNNEECGFWLLDVERDHYLNLCQVPSVQNLGLEHFYAAFGASARAFGINEDNISEDCSVSSGIANRLQPLQHGIPCETHIQKKAKPTPQEVEVLPVVEKVEESSPNCSDSEASSSSQSTCTVEAEDVHLERIVLGITPPSN